jgi:monothiol glutaredoxin
VASVDQPRVRGEALVAKGAAQSCYSRPMTRPLLPPDRILPDAERAMSELHADTLKEVRDAIEKNDVVVIGMSQNPHVAGVRDALTQARVNFVYLEYGSYFSEWRRRLAIKMWSGWPTFPQVFLRGKLVGGKDLTKAAIARGDFEAKAP